MSVVTTRAQRGWDLVIALGCAVAAVAIHVTGIDAVPANRAPDVVSVLLTVAAVVPLAVRRRAPLVALAACFPGFLGLIGARYSVGAVPIGVLVAFYTVVAWDTRRAARLAVALALVGYALALALRPIDLSVEGAVVQLALLVAGGVIGTGVRERRESHAAQAAESGRQLDLARERAAHAATEERLRISRELHDILGHAFSVMVVQAGVAEHLIDSSPADARQALAELRGTGRTSLAEMRRLLNVLREADGTASEREPAPALADLPALVARVEAAGLPVELRVSGTPAAVSAGLELAAYRVVQEALTNTIKHADARRARVLLTYAPGRLAIEVSDDGRARPAGGAPPAGHGLTGMRERVAMYGGEFTAGPTPAGYLVTATLVIEPLEAWTGTP
ncbi:sensor histidine kinase [Paractinoplanes maris]|uniref:sensor histidine kinase n=1 Tax=Paractinoplanes maris TaxID=1734446 RepID=UPI0020204B44|nr:sensor histidine kinase [Actinoplanes maris]